MKQLIIKGSALGGEMGRSVKATATPRESDERGTLPQLSLLPRKSNGPEHTWGLQGWEGVFPSPLHCSSGPSSDPISGTSTLAVCPPLSQKSSGHSGLWLWSHQHLQWSRALLLSAFSCPWGARKMILSGPDVCRAVPGRFGEI